MTDRPFARERPWTALARRTAPKGRPPTAGELYNYRGLVAQDDLTFEEHSRYVRLTHEIIRTDWIAHAPGTLCLIGEHGHKTWQIHPHAGDRAWGRRRMHELWAEIGELLGIGPPPPGYISEDPLGGALDRTREAR